MSLQDKVDTHGVDGSMVKFLLPKFLSITVMMKILKRNPRVLRRNFELQSHFEVSESQNFGNFKFQSLKVSTFSSNFQSFNFQFKLSKFQGSKVSEFKVSEFKVSIFKVSKFWSPKISSKVQVESLKFQTVKAVFCSN
jgi:hypothetical protein